MFGNGRRAVAKPSAPSWLSCSAWFGHKKTNKISAKQDNIKNQQTKTNTPRPTKPRPQTQVLQLIETAVTNNKNKHIQTTQGITKELPITIVQLDPISFTD